MRGSPDAASAGGTRGNGVTPSASTAERACNSSPAEVVTRTPPSASSTRAMSEGLLAGTNERWNHSA